LSRDKRPPRADFLLFSAGAILASSASGNVCCRDGSWLAQRSCGGPTHCLRVERPSDCREPGYGFLRPSNLSVPSDRPTQKRGCPALCASELQARGRGSPQEPCGPCASWTGARASGPSTAQGQGPGPLCAWAFVDAMGASWQSTMARLAHRDPVRRQARQLPALHAGARWRERTARLVSTENRRPGPADEPSQATPCPGQDCSLSGPAMFGPQDGGGGTGRPRRQTPPGDTHGRSVCRRGPTASPPRPWRL
jgi:hypothetical protein